jgi:Predicted membrane protein
MSERLTTDERRYLGGVGSLLAILSIGAAVWPQVVYDRFIWRYFWGPVQADALGSRCVIREGGTVVTGETAARCTLAPGPVAYPGYTVVSEVGYMVVLLVGIAGAILLLRRLAITVDAELILALVPLMIFGGGLRVLEDYLDAAVDPLLLYPWNTLLISPVIYLTVFVVALVVVLGGVATARRADASPARVVTLAGGTLAAIPPAILIERAVSTSAVMLYPQVIAVVVVGTAAAVLVVMRILTQLRPRLVRGREMLAMVVIGAHGLDGLANVVGLDWMPALDAGPNLIAKHPANQFVVDVTSAIQPAGLTAVIGDTWPFLAIKLVAAVVILWVFEPEFIEESPQFSGLLLVAIIAVGLGPGTRDVLRATFGI